MHEFLGKCEDGSKGDTEVQLEPAGDAVNTGTEREKSAKYDTVLMKSRVAVKPLTDEVADGLMEDTMMVLKTVTRERNIFLEERGYLELSNKNVEDSPRSIKR